MAESTAAAAIIHLLFKAEFSCFMACFSENMSSSAHIKYAVMPTIRGRKRMLAVIAPMKSSLPARMNEPVRPQAGQGMPVKSLNRQGM